VTPSSKAVGDMAIFMIQNGLTPENIYDKGKDMAFPDSVVSYFKGMMGQPMGGFPEELQKLVLKGEKPITGRPGELLEPENFGKIESYLRDNYKIEPKKEDVLSYALYPKVFEDYLEKSISRLQATYPFLSYSETNLAGTYLIHIPVANREGHEWHFTYVAKRFFQYLVDQNMPEWEKLNALAKYYITTKAVELQTIGIDTCEVYDESSKIFHGSLKDIRSYRDYKK
jgi:hypothetical protein